MGRIHLFELEDQSWFPSQLRSLITDLLQYQLTAFNVYQPAIPKIQEVMQKTNCNQIIDLGSGSSGSVLQIQEMLESEKKISISVTLTDKYPNIERFERIRELSNNRINYISDPIDATSVPPEYEGLRSLFTSFHHFPPEAAKKILQDAVDKEAPIGIFEFTERTISNVIKIILFAPLIVFLQTPFIRPFKWSRLFWTYVIPIAPLAYCWDALVSHLRTYSPEELQQLISEINSENYNWEFGKLKSEESSFNITYLIGFPTM